MALDFRASQFRGAKFIASGSTGTGAKLIFYDIANDSSSTPNQGTINAATFQTSSIGNDVFMFVSGTIASGSSTGRITLFGGSTKISGVLAVGFPSTIYMSGSVVTFHSASNQFGALIANGDWVNGSGINMFQDYRSTDMRVQASNVSVSGSGGRLFLVAGNAGSAYGAWFQTGGSISILAGQGGEQGDTAELAGDGGEIAITAGAGGIHNNGTAGIGGAIAITAGAGGYVLGNGSGEAGGNITITAGAGGTSNVAANGGSGGNVVIKSGYAPYLTTAQPGYIALSPGLNEVSGTSGHIALWRADYDPGSRNNDEWVIVSGSVTTGSNRDLVSFRGSVKVSGSVGFSNSVYLQREGNDLKFYDTINPQGYSLSQLASSSGGSGGGGGTLQSAYLSGSTITVNATTGSVRIIGDSEPSSSLRITSTGANRRAVSVYNTGNSAEMLQLHGTDSNFGGAAVILRSRGDSSGYIGWTNSTNELLPQGISVVDAVIYYHDTQSRLRLQHTSNAGKVAVWNPTGDFAHVDFQNHLTAPATTFYPGASNAIVFNSGSSRQAGEARYASDVTVTGSVKRAWSTVTHERLTTTDATPSILWTLAMSASAVYDVDVTILAVGTGSTLTKRFKRNVVAFTSGSSSAEIMENTVFAPVLDLSGSTTAASWDVNFRVTGSNLITHVTGAASQNIKWTLKAEYTFGGNL